MAYEFISLATGLSVFRGSLQTGILHAPEGVCLVGCGDEAIVQAGPLGPEAVCRILITHHHRDEASAIASFVKRGAEVWVPAKERELFDQVEAFWAAPQRQYHQYDFHPTNLTLRASIPVARTVQGGDTFSFGEWTIEVVDTPGHTLGSVAYLASSGEIRVGFVGDLLAGPGELWEFYSLQGRLKFPDGSESREYHGFGENVETLLESLERILSFEPSLLVPSHGVVIDRPREAVDRLRHRLNACLANYRRTSAGRWYFAQAKEEWAIGREESLQNQRPLPPWVLEPYGTSRAIRSNDGDLFLIDAAGDIPRVLNRLQVAGEIGTVDALWITHYHDDHVEAVNQVRQDQKCPVIAHERMRGILEHPAAYLMPCLHHEPILLDRAVAHGASWEWKGVRLTAYDFPGQSYYDAALLAEKEGLRVLFTGDSMTPGGLDDYCAFNRNLLGEGRGYAYCLSLLEEIQPDLLVNQHVPGAFTYPQARVQEMQRLLRERLALFGALFPWDHPNYGLDPRWIHCKPYAQVSRPGETVSFDIEVTNHSDVPHAVRVFPRLPEAWIPRQQDAVVHLAPQQLSTVRLEASLPLDTEPRRWVAGFDIWFDDRPLGEIVEALIDVIANEER